MKKISFLLLTAMLSLCAAVQAQTIFPTEFTAPAEFNTGTVRISVLSRSDRQMTTNFLFEQGSRNSWHYHPNATQVLMVLSGEAYYQEEGKPKQLLHKGDVVKLIDFGLSDSAVHSVLKIPAGTVIYTAPEVLKGAEADVRSEVYSLGLVIAALGPRHRLVVRKCCEPRPAMRYSSVAEVQKALRSKWPYISGVLFILLVAAFALYPYVSGLFSRAEVPAGQQEPVTIPIDTMALSPADTASMDPPSSVMPPKRTKDAPAMQPATSSDEPVDDGIIDELFRQATELFE